MQPTPGQTPRRCTKQGRGLLAALLLLLLLLLLLKRYW